MAELNREADRVWLLSTTTDDLQDWLSAASSLPLSPAVAQEEVKTAATR